MEVTAIAPDASSPRGVRGALGFLVLTLTIVSPIAQASRIVGVASVATQRSAFYVEAFVVAAFAGIAFYAGVALWKVWPNAPRIARRFLAASSVIAILDLVAGLTDGSAQVGTAISEGVAAAVWPVAWWLYLRRSERVRNTYAPAVEGAPLSRKWTWRVLAAMIAVMILSRAGAAYESADAVFFQQFETLAPERFIRVARQLDATFDRSFADAARKRWEADLQGSSFREPSPARFTDLGQSMRGVVELSGTAGGSRDSAPAMAIQTRAYWHAGGVATLDALCYPDVVSCTDLLPLIEQAERALIVRLSATDARGVLPETAEGCRIDDRSLQSGVVVEGVTCAYAPKGALTLGFWRLTAAQTHAVYLDSRSFPAESRRLVVLAAGSR